MAIFAVDTVNNFKGDIIDMEADDEWKQGKARLELGVLFFAKCLILENNL